MSLPIYLSINQQKKAWFKGKERLAIKCPSISNQILAIIDQPEIFEYRKEEICSRVFGTQSLKHPKVSKILNSKDEFIISGESMRFIKNIEYDDGMD